MMSGSTRQLCRENSKASLLLVISMSVPSLASSAHSTKIKRHTTSHSRSYDREVIQRVHVLGRTVRANTSMCQTLAITTSWVLVCIEHGLQTQRHDHKRWCGWHVLLDSLNRSWTVHHSFQGAPTERAVFLRCDDTNPSGSHEISFQDEVFESSRFRTCVRVPVKYFVNIQRY